MLDEVNLTLKMGSEILYDGRVRGDEGSNMITNALDLGTYKNDQQSTLEITLKVDPEMETYYRNASEAYFKWIFVASQDEGKEVSGGKTDDPKDGPASGGRGKGNVSVGTGNGFEAKTSDAIKLDLIFLALLTSLLVLLVIKKQYRRKAYSGDTVA